MKKKLPRCAFPPISSPPINRSNFFPSSISNKMLASISLTSLGQALGSCIQLGDIFCIALDIVCLLAFVIELLLIWPSSTGIWISSTSRLRPGIQNIAWISLASWLINIELWNQNGEASRRRGLELIWLVRKTKRQLMVAGFFQLTYTTARLRQRAPLVASNHKPQGGVPQFIAIRYFLPVE